MRVADRMTLNPVTIAPNQNLAYARELMNRGSFRTLPVIEDGRLVGILTERDTRQHEGYLESTRVSAAMKPNPLTVRPESSALDAARLLVEHKIGGLPVVDGDKLVGILTTSDLLRALMDVVRATEGILSD